MAIDDDLTFPVPRNSAQRVRQLLHREETAAETMKKRETVGDSTQRDDDLAEDFREHLDVLRRVTRRQFGTTHRAESYDAKLAEIERRAADPRLYLAIIGEFSSGKSTLINAMVRRRVLKAACAATTASITKVVRGQTLTVTATFADGERAVGTEDSIDELLRHVLRFHPEAAIDGPLEELLDLLTSEPTVANHVREIEVAVPSAQLDERIVIIDTPGIGAGADEAAGHAELTQSVMSDVADCALVLIPSAAPMSGTLQRFLEEHSRPFLHRCAFVITAVDRQSPDDREQVLRFVRHQLETKLGLVDPMILQSAAIAMIPVPHLPTAIEVAWAAWRPEFVQLEKTLQETMLRQRAVVVAEHLTRLLTNAVDEIARDLTARRAALAEEETALEQRSVSAIDIVLEVLEEMAQKKITSAAASIRAHVAARKEVFRAATRASVCEALQTSGWNVDSYERAVAPRVRQVIEHYGRAYAAEADGELAKMRKAATKVANEFARQFEENYRTLRALEMKIVVPSVVVSQLSVPAVAFHQSRPYVDSQQAAKKTGRNVGMVVGGLIGAMFGPIGIAIGASVGRGAGGGASGDDLASLQGRLQGLIGSDVAAFLDAYETAIDASIARIVANVLKEFRAASKRHRDEYGEVAAEMVHQYDEKRKALAHEIRAASRDAEELSRRALRLQALQQRLAARQGNI